ncbi:MAG TPA: nuclear transport factor 2 family protein [Pyrinomonadaceae bacterium]|nr:nuclear transport factor 2 family protein [Pyrinomonadaceae bacterium]
MKQCPICNTQYTDDTLQYCLQDGTPLTGAFPAGDFPSETETVISARSRRQSADPTIISGRPISEAPTPRRGRTGAIIALTALATLLIVGFAAAGFLLYLRHKHQEDARFAPDKNVPNMISTPTPSPKPSASATPSPAPSPSPEASKSPVNKSEITAEISDAVSIWADDTNAADVDRLMRNYAESVDYYKSGSVGRDAVRRDKSRALSNYDSIDVEVDDLDVTVDDSGETATAEFDKSWQFVGDQTYEGRVRSQLRFRREGGKWKIISEKDIKVY